MGFFHIYCDGCIKKYLIGKKLLMLSLLRKMMMDMKNFDACTLTNIFQANASPIS